MKKLLFPSNYIVFDIETTGLNPKQDEIIEIGAVKIVNHQVVDTFSELIRPNQKISSFITQLTGITNEMVQEAKDIETVLAEFLLFINDQILIGHNVQFDLSFIRFNFEHYLGIECENQALDNLRYARKIIPELAHHRLFDCVNYFNIYQEKAHRAQEDAQATYEVFEHLRMIYEKQIENEEQLPTLKDQIYEKEVALLQYEVRHDPILIQKYIDHNFKEFTSTGIVYQYEKNDIWEGNSKNDWCIENFEITEMDKKSVLATYLLYKGNQKSLRSSIWIKNKKEWKMIFHQGTPSY